MAAAENLGILSSPIGPPVLGRCPKCGRWFVFKTAREEESAISGTVTTYRCENCGYEQKFAERHPPHAI
jgi:hypothetical protein